MADFLSVADRTYVDLVLKEIDRDPVGHTRHAERLGAIRQLLRFGPTADEATLDFMRNRVGLPFLNPLRAATAKAARAVGLSFEVTGDTIHLQDRLPPLCCGHFATQADTFNAEVNASLRRLASVVADLARAGYVVAAPVPTIDRMTGMVDQHMIIAVAVARDAQRQQVAA